MSKVHVTDDGRVLRCVAEIRDCDFGDDRHFAKNDTDAYRKAESIMQERYETLATVKSSSRKVDIAPRVRNRSAKALTNSRSLELDVPGPSSKSNRFAPAARPIDFGNLAAA